MAIYAYNTLNWFEQSKDNDVDQLTEDKLIRYFEKKISSFKIQDRKAGREIDENKSII